MPNQQRSFPSHIQDTSPLQIEHVYSLFQLARQFQKATKNHQAWLSPQEFERTRALVAALLFFEPSTRTRLSFEIALSRLGIPFINFCESSSSVLKGESLSDTLRNIAAMNPDLLIMRYGTEPELDQIAIELPIPLMSAGRGVVSHPTQALLDAFTILQERGGLKGERVLIVGDVRHSRVTSSNIELLTRLGVEVGICAPHAWWPQTMPQHVQGFASLDEALRWATVIMGLRIQFERHAQATTHEEIQAYHMEFGLTAKRLQSFRSDGIILHPGPINHGVEFSSDVLQDQRCRVLQQVTNGVAIRGALISLMLGVVSEVKE